jgi:uncharacterized protein
MAKKPLSISLTGTLLLFLLVGVSFVLGQTTREIQERMRERLPAVDALKKEQLVGENQKGFLEELRPLGREQRRLVKEENDDRLRVYQALAAQSDATPEQVGIVRARQIAERSARGVMLQDERGRWVEK